MMLSVVIPTMNKVGHLRRTLEALAAQDLNRPGDWEIVVVNDGSTDGTAEYLDRVEFGGRPALQIVQPNANVGRARARNLGARMAQGTWLLFLDDDIVVPPGLLAAHLARLEVDDKIGTIGHAVTDPAVVDAPHFHYLDTRGTAKLAPGPAPGRYFVTQNAAVPREAFLAVDGFDEEFQAYGFEDMEVAFRLEDQCGVRFEVVPGPYPLHVHHHTLEDYLDKKVECGRHTLPRLATLHPGRLKEMRLDSVVDSDGRPSRSFSGLVLGVVCRLGLRSGLTRVVSGWPTGPGWQPRAFRLYAGLMNLLILSCFRDGLSQKHAGAAPD